MPLPPHDPRNDARAIDELFDELDPVAHDQAGWPGLTGVLCRGLRLDAADYLETQAIANYEKRRAQRR